MEKSKVNVITPVNVVGFILIMMAGWVDIVGIRVFFGERSSFMTGRASALAASIFDNEWGIALLILVVVIAFIIGAAIGTSQTKKNGLSRGLLITSFLLALGVILLIVDGGKSIYVTGSLGVSSIFIPMSMGCMNASTSMTPINRTTHLTGPTTDIGVSIANKDWNMTVFWVLRWIGFTLGAICGLILINISNSGGLPMFVVFLIPAVVIALTAIIQKNTVDIQTK